MRFIVQAIEYANDRSVLIHNGRYAAGKDSEVGLLLKRIPDNCTRPCNSNIPDPVPRSHKDDYRELKEALEGSQIRLAGPHC